MKLHTFFLTAAVLLTAGTLSAEVLIKNGESIAFLGDSITQFGNWYPCGYLHLVIDGFQRAGIKVVRIPAGISGHKSNNMLQRVQRDVINKKPTWMTLSCGVNDVWHGARGVKLEDYKKNITQLVDKVQKAGIKVMILTATMIGEDPNNENNKKLAAYNDFLRKLAAERKLPVADLNAIMQKQIAEMKKADKAFKPGKKYLTKDGVHMAKAGNIMMASGILAAFGIPEKKINECRKIWMTYPVSTKVTFELTIDEWNKLSAAAKAGKATPNQFTKDLLLNRLNKK